MDQQKKMSKIHQPSRPYQILDFLKENNGIFNDYFQI
jgi:hypothetical protein